MIASTCLLLACNNGPQLKPQVSGKAGEVGIVMDKPNWEGELGAAFREVLAADFPFLNQREPMFTLFNIPSSAFNSIFQTHRNIILANISPDITVAQMVIQENVWAAPQIVVTLSGPDAPSVLECFIQQKAKLISSIEQAERNRVISNSKRYEEKRLRMLVNEAFGGSPYFPKNYSILRQEPDFIWIAYRNPNYDQCILVYTYPYIDNATSFSQKEMLRIRNQMLKKNIPGQLEGSYMTTAQIIDPGVSWIHYNHKDFAEMRGLWEVENDFMGGPFVSHSYLDTLQNRVLVLEAFVYAPRFDKRNYLRQAESILYSFQWVKDQEDKN
jgi:hypothetical protein